MKNWCFLRSTRTWYRGFNEKRLSGEPKRRLFLVDYSVTSAVSAVSSAGADAA